MDGTSASSRTGARRRQTPLTATGRDDRAPQQAGEPDVTPVSEERLRHLLSDLLPSSGRRELLAVLLMALTSILTAWTAFQASKWGGEQTSLLSEAAATRAESVRASDRANQEFITDNAIFADWLNAVASDNPGLADFYEQRFPDELAVAFEAWLTQDPFESPDAAPTPFELDEYRLASDEVSFDLEAEAEALATDAADANQTGDDYTLTTVIFAVVLLLAAMSTKVRRDRAELALLVFGGAVFLLTTALVATFPRLL